MQKSDNIDKLKKLMDLTISLPQQDFLVLFLVLHLNSIHGLLPFKDTPVSLSFQIFQAVYVRSAAFTLLVFLGEATLPTSLAPLNSDPASEQFLLSKQLRALL